VPVLLLLLYLSAVVLVLVVVVLVLVVPQCCCCCSVWEGVPGPQVERLGPEQAVRHEGAEEGLHRAEDQDHGAHQDGETGTTATSVRCAA